MKLVALFVCLLGLSMFLYSADHSRVKDLFIASEIKRLDALYSSAFKYNFNFNEIEKKRTQSDRTKLAERIFRKHVKSYKELASENTFCEYRLRLAGISEHEIEAIKLVWQYEVDLAACLTQESKRVYSQEKKNRNISS